MGYHGKDWEIKVLCDKNALIQEKSYYQMGMVKNCVVDNLVEESKQKKNICVSSSFVLCCGVGENGDPTASQVAAEKLSEGRIINYK